MGETIKDCKHKDCIFRSTLPNPDGSCSYAMIMGFSRNCKISECDKYISNKEASIRTKINSLYEIVWEINGEDPKKGIDI